jgi:hypothetical protein
VPTAEDIFSETFSRFMKNWTFIVSLRQVADVALPIAETALAAIHTDFVEQVSNDPQYKNLIVKLDGSEATWDDVTKGLVQTGMTESAITNARTAIDAASLVFAHSVLDDCAWSYLRTCAVANPTDWEPIIAKKAITFADYRGKSPEAIRDEMIQEKLEHLERGSLLNKVDLLFQLCKPPKDDVLINNYYTIENGSRRLMMLGTASYTGTAWASLFRTLMAISTLSRGQRIILWRL